MPTYEYECTGCGHRFEVFQSMASDPLKDCPECGKAVRRLINGGGGVIFKGGGFYVTDKSGGGVKKSAEKAAPPPCANCPKADSAPCAGKAVSQPPVKTPRFFCDGCGAEVSKQVDRCPVCGKIFASIRCPKCGFCGKAGAFSDGCPRCGYSSANPSGRRQKNRRLSPLAMPLLLVVTGLFILACAFALFSVTR